MDRRNELTGNLTLVSELYHIDAMNWLIRKHKLNEYHQITLRLVSLDLDLDLASKYDRSRAHIQSLLTRGQTKASQFFQDSSLWTMHEAEGVHQAALTGTRNPSGVRLPDLSSNTECTTPCVFSGLCKTSPTIGPWQSALFNIGQNWFEGAAI